MQITYNNTHLVLASVGLPHCILIIFLSCPLELMPGRGLYVSATLYVQYGTGNSYSVTVSIFITN